MLLTEAMPVIVPRNPFQIFKTIHLREVGEEEIGKSFGDHMETQPEGQKEATAIGTHDGFSGENPNICFKNHRKATLFAV